MLPFSGYSFFIIAGILALALWASRFFLSNKHFSFALFVPNILFLCFIFPYPIHFCLLIIYAYVFTYLSLYVFKFRYKIAGIIILLLPLLLVKFDIRFHFYPFKLNNLLSFAGLSYASFRMMGLYMEQSPQEKMPPFISYVNFLSFFPTLLIGPIDRYSHFSQSEKSGFSNLHAAAYMSGFDNLLKGIVCKFILAEIVNRYWLYAIDKQSLATGDMLQTMYAYYFYLFFDFAGYSYMAIGTGKFFGIEVPVNFNNPFIAQNPQDFWRRFHISLGTWLKDNFFTPLLLFLTRRKAFPGIPVMRQHLALFATFFLMGCWNGFHGNFIISGSLFGLYSVVHNVYLHQCKVKGKDVFFGNLPPFWVKIISIVIMFHLAALALYVFSGYVPF